MNISNMKGLFWASTICLVGSVSAFAKNTDYRASIEVIPATDGRSILNESTLSGRVFDDRNRNGRLDQKEQGVAGVMVSNGKDVVRTDARGQYRLPAYDNMTVFITKPAGYQVPLDKDNVPQFFYHHLPGGSPDLRFGGLKPTGPLPLAINFPLYFEGVQDTFKIVVSGDTQTYSNNEIGYMRDTLVNELATMDDVAFVILEGDMLGDDLDLFPRFKQVMRAAEMPVYMVPGNHDLDFDANDDAHSFDTFRREWGPTYYSFDMGQVHFVVLDNVRYPCTPALDNVDGKRDFCNDPILAPNYNGVIDERQMQWLANDLAMVPRDKLIVLNHHIPLVSFVDMYATKHQTDNAAQLYRLLSGRPALTFSGHTHTLENLLPGESYGPWMDAVGVTELPFPHIVAGAVSGSWWSGDLDDKGVPMAYQRLGAPRGYLVVEFEGNRFKETFKATGKDPKQQMSMDFLTPAFNEWYEKMSGWMKTDMSLRKSTPPVNINDLPDTSIMTPDEVDAGILLVINVWNGNRDAEVAVQINARPAVAAIRTQSGEGEAQRLALDPFALKKQMYVSRYAAASTSEDERTQGFELFRGVRFFTQDPQPLPEWMLTDTSSHLWTIELPKNLEEGVHVVRVTVKDHHGREFYHSKTFEVRKNRPAPYFNKTVFQ